MVQVEGYGDKIETPVVTMGIELTLVAELENFNNDTLTGSEIVFSYHRLVALYKNPWQRIMKRDQ